MAKYDLDVVAKILLILLESPMGRTALYMRTGLNYPRFLQYLQYLKERGLVAEQDGAVKLTPKGKEVALALEEVLKHLL
ncbi:MAG: winged helix-turn-helix domain-containing protein [Pyrobaculum sp.]